MICTLRKPGAMRVNHQLLARVRDVDEEPLNPPCARVPFLHVTSVFGAVDTFPARSIGGLSQTSQSCDLASGLLWVALPASVLSLRVTETQRLIPQLTGFSVLTGKVAGRSEEPSRPCRA